MLPAAPPLRESGECGDSGGEAPACWEQLALGNLSPTCLGSVFPVHICVYISRDLRSAVSPFYLQRYPPSLPAVLLLKLELESNAKW